MTLYDENGLNPISITYNYFYDNITHLQLTRTESETSGGENKITKYFYPDDLPSFPYKTELLEQYRIGEKIKEQEYLGTKLVSTKLITYNDWGNNIIHPALLETSIYENPLEPMERFYNISSTGTPQEFSKEDDIHTAIIWGYQDTKPVIKGENINYPDLLVAVNLTISDFEQLLSPGGIGDLTSPTQRDAWKDFNRTLRSQSLLTNSLITTYTYKSLVGLTSSTDPNGVTTYYEYDGFGRLIYIRDNSYSILKKYDYHYKE